MVFVCFPSFSCGYRWVCGRLQGLSFSAVVGHALVCLDSDCSREGYAVHLAVRWVSRRRRGWSSRAAFGTVRETCHTQRFSRITKGQYDTIIMQTGGGPGDVMGSWSVPLPRTEKGKGANQEPMPSPSTPPVYDDGVMLTLYQRGSSFGSWHSHLDLDFGQSESGVYVGQSVVHRLDGTEIAAGRGHSWLTCVR